MGGATPISTYLVKRLKWVGDKPYGDGTELFLWNSNQKSSAEFYVRSSINKLPSFLLIFDFLSPLSRFSFVYGIVQRVSM